MNSDDELFNEFFLSCGVLKKYKDHAFVQKNLVNNRIDDSLVAQAVNFALAIVEQEDDQLVQAASTLLLKYVEESIANKDYIKLYDDYILRIKRLFQALSYNNVDCLKVLNMTNELKQTIMK